MPETPKGYRRRNSLRHPAYDYTNRGAYFITVCAQRGKSIFGRVIKQEMHLNPLGKLAEECWLDFIKRHDHVAGDAYVIMPNHVHLLFWMGEQHPDLIFSTEPVAREFGRGIPDSVSSYMSGYKSAVTQKAKRRGLIVNSPLWQDNFHDRIVRGNAELHRIRDYIANNPNRWLVDQLHPDAPPNKFNQPWQR
jgi:REP element-mobilizing transposase RayT